MQLLAKMSKSLEENTYVNYYMGGGGDGRIKIVNRREYYLKKRNEGAIPIKKNRRRLIGTMSDKKEELISFIYIRRHHNHTFCKIGSVTSNGMRDNPYI